MAYPFFSTARISKNAPTPKFGVWVSLLPLMWLGQTALAATHEELAQGFATTVSMDSLTCPTGYDKYEIGRGRSSDTPASRYLPIAWTAGQKDRKFTFGDGTEITIAFTNLSRPRARAIGTAKADPTFANTPSINNALNYDTATRQYSSVLSQGYLEITHDASGTGDSHTISITANRPFLKGGMVIKQFNAQYRQNVGFREGGRVATGDYIFTMPGVSTAAYTYSNNNTTVQARWEDSTSNLGYCSNASVPANYYNLCSVGVSWKSRKANESASFTHTNFMATTNETHFTAYDGFYICAKPTRLIAHKVLEANAEGLNTRYEENDQFRIAVNDGTKEVDSFTTTGTGATLTVNRTTPITLSTTATYSIVESMPTGSLNNYEVRHECQSDGKVLVTGAGSSIVLGRPELGQEITCITYNKPKLRPTYTITGKVFYDNGGTTGENAKHNGALDAGEAGIKGSNVNLVNCETKAVYAFGRTTTADDGSYRFVLSEAQYNQLATEGANKKVCVAQAPQTAGYPRDTSSNLITLPLTTTQATYANNNFGDTKDDLLILEKFQAEVPCNATGANNTNLNNLLNANYSKETLGNNSDPMASNAVSNQKCIAYKIVATNTSKINLQDVFITDKLPETATYLSRMHFYPMPVVRRLDQTGKVANTYLRATATEPTSVIHNEHGTVISKKFNLAPSERLELYFVTSFNKK